MIDTDGGNFWKVELGRDVGLAKSPKEGADAITNGAIFEAHIAFQIGLDFRAVGGSNTGLLCGLIKNAKIVAETEYSRNRNRMVKPKPKPVEPKNV